MHRSWPRSLTGPRSHTMDGSTRRAGQLSGSDALVKWSTLLSTSARCLAQSLRTRRYSVTGLSSFASLCAIHLAFFISLDASSSSG